MMTFRYCWYVRLINNVAMRIPSSAETAVVGSLGCFQRQIDSTPMSYGTSEVGQTTRVNLVGD